MIPFVIGVTGHRTIPPEQSRRIQQQAREVLRSLRQAMPNTDLVLTSALAEGADRLVATIAIEEGFALWSILPTDADEYTKDFESEVSRQEFRALLAQSSRIVNAAVSDGQPSDFAERPEIYVKVGREICRHSHALIAIWDGQPPRGPGGTASVVDMYLQGTFDDRHPVEVSFPDCGEVYWVALKNESGQSVNRLIPRAGIPEETDVLPGGAARIREIIDQGRSNLDRFNASSRRQSIDATGSARQLLPAEYPWQQDETLVDYLRLYQITEAINGEVRQKRNAALMRVIVLFVGFSLSALLYGGVVTEIWPMLTGLVLLAAATVQFITHRLSGNDELWVGTRGLAEFLRVAIAWRCTGITEPIRRTLSDEQLLPMDWLGMAAKWVDGQVRLAPRQSTELNLDPARHWVDDQLGYFMDHSNKIAFHAQKAKHLGQAATICISLAVLVYGATIGTDYYFAGSGRDVALQTTAWTMYLYWSLLSIAAVVAAYAGIKAHSELEVEYSRAVMKFRMTRIRLDHLDALKQRILIERLGRRALRETAEWIRLHRSRPLRLPF